MSEPVLKTENLCFCYPSNREDTLKGFDVHLDPGEIYGFLGPSGAGKSTAQKVFMGILKNYRGAVRIFGKEMKKSDRTLYERIGVSFELPNLYGRLTALENLRLFAGLYRSSCREPEELLDMVGLLNDGKRRVDSFSKGMKMRLNFCRALLPHPDLLFLDEPTSGLDPANAVMVRELILEERKRGAAVFLTTHNMDVAAKLCDRVAFLADGLVTAEGSPRQLSLDGGIREVEVDLSGEEGEGPESRRFPLEGIGTNHDFYAYLNRGRVEKMRTLEASLEDLFLKVTGTRLSGGEGE
jgi:fluoroquinolone transport system ATP-binding protein